MSEHPDSHQSADAHRTEINVLRRATDRLARRQIVIWCIRWAIGFGIVAFVTTVFGAYYWLWPLALVMAGMSLGFTLYYRRKLQQRFEDADETADRLEEALKQFEETSAAKEAP